MRIIHETNVGYAPQSNGVVERKNRTLQEMVNSMLSYLNLSNGFWGEAIQRNLQISTDGNIGLENVQQENPHEDDVDENKQIVLQDTPLDEEDIPRRSKRKGQAKTYGPDFHVYLVEEDPLTYNDAMESHVWKEVNKEMDSIMGTNVWVLVDLPPSCKLIGYKWIF
ncbi:uncharacterized protein LOC130813448 [Amaranthus tricolor]|uniref:uncharacterized protein LOC130813448 n=1 Tax=Amaranthus tricolor TaxID=29722 RepID=UPI0025907FC3|nr:uncharacterized protein LOC130813448 [Amaranthus tricolor]